VAESRAEQFRRAVQFQGVSIGLTNWFLRNLRAGSMSRKVPSGVDANVVEEGLLLGSMWALHGGLEWLSELGVTRLLSVLPESALSAALPAATVREMDALVESGQLLQRFVPVEDTPETAETLTAAFESCHSWIEAARNCGKAVFVHCAMGISRSTTIVCSHLMRRHGISAETALDRVRENRPIVLPNSGFRTALNKLEYRLIPALAQSFLQNLLGQVSGLVVDYIGLLKELEPFHLAYGDRFPCKSYQLPTGDDVFITSSRQVYEQLHFIKNGARFIIPDGEWKECTVTVEKNKGSWCLIRLDTVDSPWLLLQETGDDPFCYTLFTLPHLDLERHNPMYTDNEAYYILANSLPHFIVCPMTITT
jgi:protein-tyrosine phosphatase